MKTNKKLGKFKLTNRMECFLQDVKAEWSGPTFGLLSNCMSFRSIVKSELTLFVLPVYLFPKYLLIYMSAVKMEIFQRSSM